MPVSNKSPNSGPRVSPDFLQDAAALALIRAAFAAGAGITIAADGTISASGGAAGVSTFNTRNGDVTLSKADVTATGLAAADIAAANQTLGNLTNAATARTNLGLGGAAVLNVGTTTGTVAAGDDSRITGAAQKASNLSDLASASTSRTNLGLGTAATQASTAFDAAGAATAAQAAAIAASAQRASNLSDLASAATSRTNLGLAALAASASAADISAGTLPTTRGGTGITDQSPVWSTLGWGVLMGTASTPSMNAANDALIMRMRPRRNVTLAVIRWSIGTASGNFDMAIYNAAGTTRLWHLGSTAVPAAGVDARAVTPLSMTADTDYYFLFAVDNATATFRGLGVANQTGFFTDISGAPAVGKTTNATLAAAVPTTITIPVATVASLVPIMFFCEA